jgi:ribulose-phosphate 3-epimerase
VTGRIAPSLLCADFTRLGDDVRALQDAGADLLHFDVMDNHYVPNLTIGPLICEAIRPLARVPIDVHIMAEPVDDLAVMFARAGAGIITVHPEATRHLDRTLALIRDQGCQAGLALNPATPLDWLDHVMDRLDLILVMSVNPGFAGQAFIGAALDKIALVRRRIDAHVRAGGKPIALEVDGGVKVANIHAVAQAGADSFVAGSAIFGARDADGGFRDVIAALRRELAQAGQQERAA